MDQKPLVIGEPSYAYHHLFKILLLGDKNVGKTSLLSRYVDDVYPGVQADAGFRTKTVLTKSVIWKLQLWDSEKVTHNMIRGSSAIMIVYDVTNLTSFDNVKFWLDEILASASDFHEVDKLLVGNKCDLLKSSSSVVDRLVAKEFADNLGIPFIETSALESTNVEDAFEILGNAMQERRSAKSAENAKQTKPISKENECLLH